MDRLPSRMRHWFEREGIYLFGQYGLHRSWRRDGMLNLYSKKARFQLPRSNYKADFHRPDMIGDPRRFWVYDGRMHICDGIFDKWSNSSGASIPIPQTHAEFKAGLEKLLRMSRNQPNGPTVEIYFKTQ